MLRMLQKLLWVGLFLLSALSVSVAEESPIKVRLGWQPTINGARFFIAEAEDLFRKEGLDVQLVKFSSGAAFFAAFQSSTIDVGFLGIPPAATAVAQGIPIKIFAVESDAADSEGLVARNNSGIATLADLRGKRVGARRGSSGHTSLLLGLSRAGLKESDIRFVDIDIVALLPAFRRGDIDAAWFWEPWMGLLKREGGTLIITDRGINKPDGIVWAARSDWLTSNEAATQRLFSVLDKATDLIRSDPARMAKIIARRLELTEDHVLDVLTKQTKWPTNAEVASTSHVFSMSPEVVRAGGGIAAALLDSAEFQKSAKIIQSIPDYSKEVDAEPLALFLSRK